MADKRDWQYELEEYIRQGEPTKAERSYAWRTAIGLQDVDGLKPSEYLYETAKKNIDGEISIDEVQKLTKVYYVSKTKREPDDEEKEEADKVAGNISKILATQTLDFSTNGYIALHRRIFNGVFKRAGQIRDYDITKKEFVLRGGTVNYLNHEDLRAALDYEIDREKRFDYRGLSSDELTQQNLLRAVNKHHEQKNILHKQTIRIVRRTDVEERQPHCRQHR